MSEIQINVKTLIEELRTARISCAECGHKLFMIVRLNATTTMTCCYMCGHAIDD